MNFITDEGIILKLNRLKEYDSIATIFTREHGKLEFYLRNVRSPRSKRGINLEILNIISFQMAQPSAEAIKLPNLTEFKLIDQFKPIKSSENLFSESFALAEILNNFLPVAEAQQQLFDLCKQTAGIEAEASSNLSLKVFVFLSINLLAELGFLPELNICQRTGEKLQVTDSVYPLEAEVGYAKDRTDEAETQGLSSSSEKYIKMIKIQNFAVQQQDIEAFLKLNLEESLIKDLVRIHIGWVETVLERELKSKQILFSSLS